MIVIGVDPHKGSHTAVAVDASIGKLIGARTVKARDQGHDELVRWSRSLGSERVFAIEDCRHVSGGLERFLLGHAERVVRVSPKLMAGERGVSRQRGKSDEIDALSVARAAVREGLENLPCARLDQPTLEIKLLLDHREDLIGERTRVQNRLRWHLHDLIPELEVPAGALDRLCWLDKIARKLTRSQQTTRVRVSRSLVKRLRELARECSALESEIARLVRAHTPELLAIQGCGALTAAKLLAETAGVDRFASEARFARHAGVAPVPVSSGRRQRHRLDRGGNRQLNCALHRIAVVQARTAGHPGAEYLAARQAEGKSRLDAVRCLKRHIARTIWKLLWATQPTRPNKPRSIVQALPPAGPPIIGAAPGMMRCLT
jgi:transposase